MLRDKKWNLHKLNGKQGHVLLSIAAEWLLRYRVVGINILAKTSMTVNFQLRKRK